MHRLVSGVALFIVAACLSTAWAEQKAGEVYQWKDAKGITHYSQTPPARGPYQQRVITHADNVAPVATATAVAAVDNTQCMVAKRNIAALDSERPVGQDADGDGHPDATMTPEQRSAQRTLAEAAVKAYCTP